jgi:hypothetical protein
MYKLREIQIVDDGLVANLCFAGFMVLYLVVEEFATVSRENRLLRFGALGIIELVRVLFHIVFIVIVITYYNKVIEVDEEARILRSRALIGMFFLVCCSEALVDIICPFVGFGEDSIVWDVWKAAGGQAYFAAFSLFFKRKLTKYDINPFVPAMRLDGSWNTEMA